jgi:predicted molibdopterin-dependent oxidoreductase YjgC
VPPHSDGWNIYSLSGKKKLKVLYLVGDVPPADAPRAEFVIWQNIYPPYADADVDLVLPSAAFTEIDGTYVNGEGRLQRVRKGVEPFGRSLPDWSIFGLIAEKMGVAGFNFVTAADVHREISSLVDGFDQFDEPSRAPHALAAGGKFEVPAARTHRAEKADQSLPYLLSVSMAEHTHRGFPLATWVEGARQLLTEGVVEMHPEDAVKMKVKNGDQVEITSPQFDLVRPVLLHANQPAGMLHVTLRHGETITPNPHPVKIRKKT